jgi:hypothetical protein
MLKAVSPAVPKGLRPGSIRIWRTLTSAYDCADHELLALERALKWFDKADTWIVEADALTGRAAAAKLKQAMDASTCGLRFWKTLKFRDDLARRIGRPSGDAWSPKRKLQAAAARAQ